MNEDYKKSEDWLRFRRHWLRGNPPSDGNYLCGICARWVAAEEVTLDHIEPRTAENMFNPDNIQPAHGSCNYHKGSKRWNSRVNKETQEFMKFLGDM